jgi:thioredoxin 1
MLCLATGQGEVMSFAMSRLSNNNRVLWTALFAVVVSVSLGSRQPALAEVLSVDDSSYKAEIEDSSKPVFIDFYATWCGPCKKIAPVVEELAEEYKNTVKFVRVDVDKAPKTAERFNIEPLPTLVLRSKKVGKGFSLTGLQSKDAIKKFIDDNLKKI